MHIFQKYTIGEQSKDNFQERKKIDLLVRISEKVSQTPKVSKWSWNRKIVVNIYEEEPSSVNVRPPCHWKIIEPLLLLLLLRSLCVCVCVCVDRELSKLVNNSLELNTLSQSRAEDSYLRRQIPHG